MILAGAIAANLVVIGAAIGGYGHRMVLAMLPHGPVELAAYSLALALYLRGPSPQRCPQLHDRGWRASVALLAIAAVLETFVTV